MALPNMKAHLLWNLWTSDGFRMTVDDFSKLAQEEIEEWHESSERLGEIYTNFSFDLEAEALTLLSQLGLLPEIGDEPDTRQSIIIKIIEALDQDTSVDVILMLRDEIVPHVFQDN